MKNKILKTSFAACIFLLIAGFSSNLNAQNNDSNVIPEVKLIKSDNFNQIKDYLHNNFDYTEVESLPGVYNSDVKFEIDENGKVKNVKANGDCKYVDKELEQTLNEMMDALKSDKNAMATTYIMPVRLVLER